MSVIIILIVVSVLVAVLFLAIFIWAVRSGQYDDTYSPSVRMLFDDKVHPAKKDADENNENINKPQKN